MQTSQDRILTTHVGSLPRNPTLRDLLVRQDRGEAIDEAELARQVEQAVRTVVRRQLEAGIDVGNDGEQPRVGFSTYVARRMRGSAGRAGGRSSLDLIEFPDYAAMLSARRRSAARINDAPQAVAEVAYDGPLRGRAGVRPVPPRGRGRRPRVRRAVHDRGRPRASPRPSCSTRTTTPTSAT